MGSWGPGLYSSDDAVEIKRLVQSIVRFPKDGDELFEIIKTYYPCDSSDDDLYSVLHLVVADQFHKYGIVCEELFDLAKRIIESGIDDRLMTGLSMSETDRRKRRRQLEGLYTKWATPPERLASRTILHAPQKHPLEPGDICIYPTKDGNSANINDPLQFIQEGFDTDGWAGFAVGRNEHRLGLFSVSYILRLHVDGPAPPDFETCRTAPITGQILRSLGWITPRPAAGWAPMTPTVLKKLLARKIGAVNISWDLARKRMNATDFDPLNEPPPVHNILHVNNKTLSEDPAQWDIGAPLNIRLSELTAD